MLPLTLLGQEKYIMITAEPININFDKLDIDKPHVIEIPKDSIGLMQCIGLKADTIDFQTKVKLDKIIQKKYSTDDYVKPYLIINKLKNFSLDSLMINKIVMANPWGFVQWQSNDGNCINKSMQAIIDIYKKPTCGMTVLWFNEINVIDLIEKTEHKLLLTIKLK